MDTKMLKEFFLLCSLINYAILLIWFGAFVFARTQLHELHSRWFRLSDETFDITMYAGMAVYKLMILIFALVPYISLVLIVNDR
jgi:hypothetical protein